MNEHLVKVRQPKVYYLAGPMTGIPQFNVPAFDSAAFNLRSRGYNIVSPAELDAPEVRARLLESPDGVPQEGDDTWGDYLSRDVKIVADACDGVILLPGWQQSKGAMLECVVNLLRGGSFMRYTYNEVETVNPQAVATEIGRFIGQLADVRVRLKGVA